MSTGNATEWLAHLHRVREQSLRDLVDAALRAACQHPPVSSEVAGREAATPECEGRRDGS